LKNASLTQDDLKIEEENISQLYNLVMPKDDSIEIRSEKPSKDEKRYFDISKEEMASLFGTLEEIENSPSASFLKENPSFASNLLDKG